MKIVFFSNFISEHQIPLCNKLYELCKKEFWFVATEELSEERKSLGFVDQSAHLPYIVKMNACKEQYEKASVLAETCDVMIFGGGAWDFLNRRLALNKVTFRYSERYFKRGQWRILDPRAIRMHYLEDTRYRNKPYYYLAAGAYCAEDLKLIAAYPNKIFKWGYFPKTEIIDDIDSFIAGKDKTTILWVSRFIDWKHPEVAIQLAQNLKEKGYDFRIQMVGAGELIEVVKKQVSELELSNYVSVLGALPPKEVRKKMNDASIFIFTSDRNEGWGAVLNESMNSGCAVVANHEIGAVPFLIEDGVNGFIYKNGNLKELSTIVQKILDNDFLRRKIARNAYFSIVDCWNAEIAAERFFMLSEQIINNCKTDLFEDGVCSHASILHLNSFRRSRGDKK